MERHDAGVDTRADVCGALGEGMTDEVGVKVVQTGYYFESCPRTGVYCVDSVISAVVGNAQVK